MTILNHNDMKNQDIINLVSNGIMATTAHDIPARYAYQVLKFKKAVREAFTSIQAAEREMFTSEGVEDTKAFNDRLTELRESLSDNSKELGEMETRLARLNALQAELRGEEATLKNFAPLPYDVWHDLQNENRAVEFCDEKKDILSGWVEDLLENILWIAPEGDIE